MTSELPNDDGFTIAFAFCAIALVVGLATTALIPGRERTAPEAVASAA